MCSEDESERISRSEEIKFAHPAGNDVSARVTPPRQDKCHVMGCDVMKRYAAFNSVVGSVSSVLNMQRLALEGSCFCVCFFFTVFYKQRSGKRLWSFSEES